MPIPGSASTKLLNFRQSLAKKCTPEPAPLEKNFPAAMMAENRRFSPRDPATA
jgi:hypothetical protein